MKHTQRMSLSLSATALVLAVPAASHHSWSGTHDLGRSKQITGTVSGVKFQSPHSAIILDVESIDGKHERWTVEWGSPHRLRERGVTATTIRRGDVVSVNGHPHRDAATRSLRMQSLRRASDGFELGN